MRRSEYGDDWRLNVSLARRLAILPFCVKNVLALAMFLRMPASSSHTKETGPRGALLGSGVERSTVPGHTCRWATSAPSCFTHQPGALAAMDAVLRRQGN